MRARRNLESTSGRDSGAKRPSRYRVSVRSRRASYRRPAHREVARAYLRVGAVGPERGFAFTDLSFRQMRQRRSRYGRSASRAPRRRKAMHRARVGNRPSRDRARLRAVSPRRVRFLRVREAGRREATIHRARVGHSERREAARRATGTERPAVARHQARFRKARRHERSPRSRGRLKHHRPQLAGAHADRAPARARLTPDRSRARPRSHSPRPRARARAALPSTARALGAERTAPAGPREAPPASIALRRRSAMPRGRAPQSPRGV